jgi:hypothetical protein
MLRKEQPFCNLGLLEYRVRENLVPYRFYLRFLPNGDERPGDPQKLWKKRRWYSENKEPNMDTKTLDFLLYHLSTFHKFPELLNIEVCIVELKGKDRYGMPNYVLSKSTECPTVEECTFDTYNTMTIESDSGKLFFDMTDLRDFYHQVNYLNELDLFPSDLVDFLAEFLVPLYKVAFTDNGVPEFGNHLRQKESSGCL